MSSSKKRRAVYFWIVKFRAASRRVNDGIISRNEARAEMGLAQLEGLDDMLVPLDALCDEDPDESWRSS
jgi:hypothetical protein